MIEHELSESLVFALKLSAKRLGEQTRSAERKGRKKEEEPLMYTVHVDTITWDLLN